MPNSRRGPIDDGWLMGSNIPVMVGLGTTTHAFLRHDL